MRISLSESPIDTRWKLSQLPKSKIITVAGRYSANHAGARLAAIESGLGVGCAPSYMAEDKIRAGALVPVISEWKFETNDQGDVWGLYPPTRPLSAKSAVFIKYLAECLSQNRLNETKDYPFDR